MSLDPSLRLSFKERLQANYLQDLDMGLQNLLLHKLRSLLTMLGMIFGVAAVIAMLSIGAGARQQAMAFIEQLGVRNLIVEAKESLSWDDLQKVRKTSKGLTLQDYRVIRQRHQRHRLNPAKEIYSRKIAAETRQRHAGYLRRESQLPRNREPSSSIRALL